MYFDSCESDNDCKQRDSKNNFKCPHIEEYKIKHGLDSYEIVHGFFVSCIGKDSRIRKARDCVCKADSCKARFKKVHACLYCAYFGCFGEKHIHHHCEETQHVLAVDSNFGHVYCFKCKDYQYDLDFEAIANRHRIVSARQRPDLAIYKYVPQARDIECFKKLQPSKLVLEDIGLRGIVNMGSTCYISCILQSLMHAPVLRDYFLSDDHKCSFQAQASISQEALSKPDSVCFSCEMGKMVQEFYSGNIHPYVPHRLLYLIWTHVKSLAAVEQHDAHEFLLEFLNLLHTHCKGTNSQIEHHANCMMDKFFTGFSQSEITCLTCKSVSTKVVSFKDISLDVNSQSIPLTLNSGDKKNGPKMPKLIDCLDRLTQAEEISQRTCDKCQSKQKCSMQMKLKKLPLIITFHLNRLSLVYNNQPIEFPEHLDLTPYMSYYNVQNDASGSESVTRNGYNKSLSNKFYLFAVVKHSGNASLGHYTSYIRIQKNKWFFCDDEKITCTEFEEVRKIPAYLLFYHKEYLENDGQNVIENYLTSNKVS